MNLFQKSTLIFLNLLNSHDVRYLLIGGFAVNFYGFNRYTADMDLWVDPSKENTKKLLDAISNFGFEIDEIKHLIEKPSNDSFIRLPLEDDFKIELLTKIDGKIKFEEAYIKRQNLTIKKLTIPVIEYSDLIENKLYSRRPKDLEDIAQLNKIHSKINRGKK